MSENLFEKYLRNELSEEEARRLHELLKGGEERRRFTEFLQEWTLLADVSRGLVVSPRQLPGLSRTRATQGSDADESLARAGRQGKTTPTPRLLTRQRPMGVAPSGMGGRAWWFVGLAASFLFMVGLFVISKPNPSAPKGPVVANAPTPPALPPRPLLVPRHEAPSIPTAQTPEPVTPRPDPAPAPPAPDSQPALLQPRPAPKSPQPEGPAPPPAVVESSVTVVAVAELLRVEGPVRVSSVEALVGQPLLQGSALEVAGPQGSAAFRFPDGTVVELAAGTRIEKLAERVEADRPAGAKSLLLVRGSLTVRAVKQPGGRPMVLSTPHADVTVLGTQFRLTATADSTRLEVAEGRVKLARRPDGASVEVVAGYAATAAKGVPLESRPQPVAREFQDGASPGPAYAGTTDTSLSEVDPHANAGRAEILEVDGDETGGKSLWGLLRWDLSEIPTRSVVKEVTITLTVAGTTKSLGYSFFELRRPWVETEATWRYYANGRAWRGARSHLDRGSESLGIFAPREKGAMTLLLNDAGTAVVQAWVRNPAANHGFLIGSDTSTDGFTFESRESPTPKNRPKITVTYQPAAPK